MPSCLRLLVHVTRLAASRTFCTAGSNRPISTAMMAITTSSSMSVNARRRGRGSGIMIDLASMKQLPRNENLLCILFENNVEGGASGNLHDEAGGFGVVVSL